MFNSEFDTARQSLKLIQSHTVPMATRLNEVNPTLGGPGLDAHDVHMMIGNLVANLENLSQTVGRLVDYLDERHISDAG